MSRIGKNPVPVPSEVTVSITEGIIKVKGPKGELSLAFHPKVSVSADNENIKISVKGTENFDKSLHGLTRSLVANMVTGVTKGFKKTLEIQGVGYRAEVKGKKLVLALGFSHPIEYEIPQGVTISMDKEKKNLMAVEGIDKQAVGQAAAVIRGFRPPEPYKGKGIRYQGEHVVRKVGKAAATAKGA